VTAAAPRKAAGFVIRWIYAPSDMPFLRVERQWSDQQKKSVMKADWERTKRRATIFPTEQAALEMWDDMGLSKRSYMEVVPA
jgi:hypothetical protein